MQLVFINSLVCKITKMKKIFIASFLFQIYLFIFYFTFIQLPLLQTLFGIRFWP